MVRQPDLNLVIGNLLRDARKTKLKEFIFNGSQFDVDDARYHLAHLYNLGIVEKENILDILKEIGWEK